MQRHQPSTTIRIVIIPVFAAVALATNYALIGITNVKIMDALVFLAAFLFGLKVGVAVGASTWIVYGVVNPHGSADLILLSFLITGECFYAVAGAGLRNTATAREILESATLSKRFSLLFGTVGLLATFAYDVLTHFASWLFRTNSLYTSFVLGQIYGAPFSLLHEISNLFLFGTIPPAARVAVRKLGWANLAEMRDS